MFKVKRSQNKHADMNHRSEDTSDSQDSNQAAGKVTGQVVSQNKGDSITRDGSTTKEAELLLIEERVRRKQLFETKFLRDCSQRQCSVPVGLIAASTKPDDMKRHMFWRAYSVPQFGLEKNVRSPYWLTCSYNMVPDRKRLVVLLRQTGTVPGRYGKHVISEMCALLYIKPGSECYNLVLVKSDEDRSFQSHEVDFEKVKGIAKKTLCLKLFIHKNPFQKIFVAKWKIPLTDCSGVQKIACKRFFSDMSG